MSLCNNNKLLTLSSPTGFSEDFAHICHRRIYPGAVVILLIVFLLKFQLKQFKRLYVKIKNEK